MIILDSPQSERSPFGDQTSLGAAEKESLEKVWRGSSSKLLLAMLTYVHQVNSQQN